MKGGIPPALPEEADDEILFQMLLVMGLCQGRRLEDAIEFCMEMLEAGRSSNLKT